MTDYLKIILLSIGFLLPYEHAVAQDLEEKMFEFKSVADTTHVKAELFVLKNNKFCIIRYTEKENKVTGGTYFVTNDSLHLTFKPKIVTLGVHGNFRIYLRKKKADLPLVSFQVAKDNSDQLYGTLYHETLPLASRSSDHSEEHDRLNSLLDSPEWKVLEGRRIRDLKREWKEEN